MSPEITLYTHPQSRGCKIRWLLEETGLPYEVCLLNYGAEMKSEHYMKIHPLGKVPAIVHGDKTISETAAICAYVADVFPDTDLAPAPDQRHKYYQWMFFGAGPVEQAMCDKARGLEVKDGEQKMLGYSDFTSLKQVLDQICSPGPYLLGEKFSVVDICLGSNIGWGMKFGLIEETPILEAYWKRIEQRPAYQAACRKDEQASEEMDGPE